MSQDELAKQFAVGQSTISRVVRGEHRETLRASHIRERAELRRNGQKRCATCSLVKSHGEFHKNRAQPDGCSTDCAPCACVRHRARHEENPEAKRRQAAAWAADPKNRDAVRRRSRRAASARRARIRDAFVEHVDPQIVFERDEGVCGICHSPVDRDSFDVDHIVPLALAGEHSYANVRLAHVACNRRRGRLTGLVLNARKGVR